MAKPEPRISFKNWELYRDAEGNSIFPVEGARDYIVYLVQGEKRIGLQIPHEYFNRLAA